MRTPARWYGAKKWLIKHLLPLPPHRIYVEVFGGAATLLFALDNPNVEIDVYNDIDHGLNNFFLVLQDHYQEGDGLFLQGLLELTMHSREEYIWCREHWRETNDVVEKARRFFVVMHQAYNGGVTSGFRFSKNLTTNGLSPATARWLSAIARLPQAIERLRAVQIEDLDFARCIEKYDAPDAFFYLDPPYIHSERVDKKSYTNEMDDEDHERLVACLLNIRGMAVLSGYDHPIYRPLNKAGWTKGMVSRVSNAPSVKKGGERGKQREFLWFSPNYPKEFIRESVSV